MRKVKTDVLIVIEHKVRELEGACLLKYEFEKRGYSVVIDSIYPNKELLPLKYTANIIIVPWAYNDKDMEYLKCFFKYSPNAKLINMHYEQYSGQDDKNICLPSGDAIGVFHVSWGKKFTDGLIKSGCLPEMIFTVGSIRLDFYKEKLKEIFSSKECLSNKYNINKNKEWILFIANGYHLMPDWKIDSIANSDERIYEKKDAAIKCRLDFLQFVDKYLSINNDKIFIYRPHPVYADLDKKNRDLNNLLKKYPNNFYVIADMSINSWLVNSDLCISFHSTSAVECCACKTPYYLFRTKNIAKELDYSFFNDYKYIICNYTDFLNAVRLNNYDNSVLKSSLNDYYVMNDDYTFVNLVNSILKCNDNKINKYTFKMWVKNSFRARTKLFIAFFAKIKLFNFLFKKIGDSRVDRIINRDGDYFSINDINDNVKKISNCFNKKWGD